MKKKHREPYWTETCGYGWIKLHNLLEIREYLYNQFLDNITYPDDDFN